MKVSNRVNFGKVIIQDNSRVFDRIDGATDRKTVYKEIAALNQFCNTIGYQNNKKFCIKAEEKDGDTVSLKFGTVTDESFLGNSVFSPSVCQDFSLSSNASSDFSQFLNSAYKFLLSLSANY